MPCRRGRSKCRRLDRLDATTVGEGIMRAWRAKHQWRMHGDIECSRLHAWSRVVGRWFWTKFHPSRAFSWLCPILQGLRWMKVWNSKDLGLNGRRCRLPTCPSICMLPGVLPTETVLRMKSSHWLGLQKWRMFSDEMPAVLHNLPKSLLTLTFDESFNQGLRHVRMPPGLQSLTFGDGFDQSLDSVTWPAGLQCLTFGDRFNQSLDNVTWPASLQSLTFGRNFNHSLDNVIWPAGLQSLTFGHRFNQSLDDVTWPAGLQSLTFGHCFNQRLGNVTWPARLQSLALGTHFNHSLGQRDCASRTSKFDFSWSTFQSEPGQRDMASRPSKFDFRTAFQSQPGQSDMASKPSKFDVWFLFWSWPG